MIRRIMYLGIGLILLAAGAVNADWSPGQDHKMHYPQLPDEAGWDVNATSPVVLADDWMCGGTGWVKDIHFWGSWMHGIECPIISFNLSIHADIPADPPSIPYSRPGITLWQEEIPFDQVIAIPMTAPTFEGWYDPSIGQFFFDDHEMYYQYNVFLPEYLWFWQEEGTIYWLNISATIADPAGTQWGWKSTLDHWNDDAVWAFSGDLDWIDIWEPPDFSQSLDLAFVITAGQPVGACCYPDPTGGPDMFCVQTTATDCAATYGGFYQGDGTLCAGMEACCLQGGACINADALCCVNELGGVPQGPGTVCSAPEACCLPGGSCVDADPICCDDLGGVPQGPGTVCTQSVACCLSDGSCIMVDPECCDDIGGSPQGPGTFCTQTEACCMPNGTCQMYDPLCCDDLGGTPQGPGTSCSGVTIACCFPDGSCMTLDPICCDDLGGTPSPTGALTCLGDGNGNGIDDACEVELDTCTYYKNPYNDYAPAGMPDFDQKQDAWISPFTGAWSWCGPVSLANCIWWFDSKFEDPASPQPPIISDSYPLISAYGAWDDHSPNNVMPFVQALAATCNTDVVWPGTILWDLRTGFDSWIVNNGLDGSYSTYVVLGPEWEVVHDSVVACQDVILLLGFYELLPEAPWCQWVGGHYVTACGVCDDDPAVCVSDPYFDKNEGEPPAGGAHGSGVHNDAALVSGPHGTLHHDKYHLIPNPMTCPSPATWMFTDYPNNWADVSVFENENPIDPLPEPVTYFGGQIAVLLDAALIICPVPEEPEACCLENGSCVMVTPSDCVNLNGTPQGPGTQCQGVEACCLQNGQCINADALCCVSMFGGTPQGPGTQCTNLEACCLPDGSCINLDPLCCDDLGGVPQGPGTQCTAPEACCFQDGSCQNLDPLCCDDLGGVPQGPGAQCTAPEACCFQDGSCQNLDPLCCDDLGGTPQGSGTQCGGVQACCLPNHSCMMADAVCCIDLGGAPQGSGTQCTEEEACCLPSGDCLMMDPLCCDEIGGHPQGPGTQCSMREACCLPGPQECRMLDPLCCTNLGGTPQGQGTVCGAPKPCCFGDQCLMIDPLCCDDFGGTPSPIGATTCLGDNDGSGIDDACEGGWNPGDPYKMHYPQLPDEQGWDVNATWPTLMADDWMCSGTGPVKDIHFWGSWLHGITGQLNAFTLRIYSDIPAEQSPTGYSMPGEQLWQLDVTDFGIVPIESPTSEGWYDPTLQLVLFDDHFEYFQYNIYLDSLDWFYQEEGTIYWLNITAYVETPVAQWGWKSSIEHFNDDAVWTGAEPPFLWEELYEPPDFTTSLDLAFVITAGAVCDCTPGDADGNGFLNIADAVYLISYIFGGGPAPTPYAVCSGDADCNCLVNIADAVYLISYIFGGGPAPCDCDEWLLTCGPPLR